MNPRAISKWAAKRKRGQLRFIFLDGCLEWGLTTAVLWSVFMWIFMPAFDLAAQAPIAFVIFPVLGAFAGWANWRLAERQFQKASSQQPLSLPPTP